MVENWQKSGEFMICFILERKLPSFITSHPTCTIFFGIKVSGSFKMKWLGFFSSFQKLWDGNIVKGFPKSSMQDYNLSNLAIIQLKPNSCGWRIKWLNMFLGDRDCGFPSRQLFIFDQGPLTSWANCTIILLTLRSTLLHFINLYRDLQIKVFWYYMLKFLS